MILTLAGPLSVVAATLENTDSQEYEFQIQEPGRAHGSQYRILEHCKADLCFYGCEMTMLGTGQKVWVNQRDAVVISNRAMRVERGANLRGGW